MVKDEAAQKGPLICDNSDKYLPLDQMVKRDYSPYVYVKNRARDPLGYTHHIKNNKSIKNLKNNIFVDKHIILNISAPIKSDPPATPRQPT